MSLHKDPESAQGGHVVPDGEGLRIIENTTITGVINSLDRADPSGEAPSQDVSLLISDADIANMQRLHVLMKERYAGNIIMRMKQMLFMLTGDEVTFDHLRRITSVEFNDNITSRIVSDEYGCVSYVPGDDTVDMYINTSGMKRKAEQQNLTEAEFASAWIQSFIHEMVHVFAVDIISQERRDGYKEVVKNKELNGELVSGFDNLQSLTYYRSGYNYCMSEDGFQGSTQDVFHGINEPITELIAAECYQNLMTHGGMVDAKMLAPAYDLKASYPLQTLALKQAIGLCAAELGIDRSDVWDLVRSGYFHPTAAIVDMVFGSLHDYYAAMLVGLETGEGE